MLRQSLGNEWVELGEKLTARRLGSTGCPSAAPFQEPAHYGQGARMPLTFTWIHASFEMSTAGQRSFVGRAL